MTDEPHALIPYSDFPDGTRVLVTQVWHDHDEDCADQCDEDTDNGKVWIELSSASDLGHCCHAAWLLAPDVAGDLAYALGAGDLAGALGGTVSRSERDTVPCQWCGTPMPAHHGPGRARKYHSDACRQAAHRAGYGKDWADFLAAKAGPGVTARDIRLTDAARLADAPETAARVKRGEITTTLGILKAAKRERGEDQ